METSNKCSEPTNSFEVEAKEGVRPDDIYNYFKSIIYIASFDSTAEAISTIEKMKLYLIQEKKPYSNQINLYMKAEKEKAEITYQTAYEEISITQFMKAYGTEGIEHIDQETISKTRSVISYLAKKVGANFLNGKSIMNISLPIYIFDKRSMLETWAFQHKAAYYFLERAADKSCPKERLKLIMTYMIIGANLQLNGYKPFNPILGETFQTKIGSSSIYVEQTSHHPPLFNYYVKNPKYTCFGYKGLEASTGPNTLTAEHCGKLYIQFNDSNLFKLTPGKFTMTGLTVGKRFINYENFMVEDITNNTMAYIKINPDERSLFSKLFSSKKTFPDYFVGFIANKKDIVYEANSNTYKVNEVKNTLSNIQGEWTNYVNFDGVNYWKQGGVDLLKMEKMQFTLPSDSTYREDILLFKNGHVDSAQEVKNYLEDVQRSDRKLREISGN